MVERGYSQPWLDEEPAILPGDEFYVDAFWELSTCRHIGMSMGPIPWNEIINYADVSQLDPDLVPMFVLTIRALDNEYLSWVDKKRERDKPKSPKKPGKFRRKR